MLSMLLIIYYAVKQQKAVMFQQQVSLYGHNRTMPIDRTMPITMTVKADMTDQADMADQIEVFRSIKLGRYPFSTGGRGGNLLGLDEKGHQGSHSTD